MNENLNLEKILKYCPKGAKLYSPALGEVDFEAINYYDRTYHIIVKTEDGTFCFTKQGKLYDMKQNECLLFPSKDQRDWSKFEVRAKIDEPKFDPKTLKPFDKVLGFFNGVWNCDLYSHYYNDDRMFPYVCFRSCVNRIISYNDDTKHLVGTAEEAPEYYRYWED